MAPVVFLHDPDVRLFHGDALETLQRLPASSVNQVVTSPPFWQLRDYLVEGQIGLESSPAEYVETLTWVFHECRRVLKPEGTLWVEMEDSHAGSGKGPGGSDKQRSNPGSLSVTGTPKMGHIKPKDLIGLPWTLALALREDGWYLRQCMIWHKPDAMPESFGTSEPDRCTTDHSYIFMFAARRTYYFDADALRTPYITDGRTKTTVKQGEGSIQHRDGERWPNPKGANARTVWKLSSDNNPGPHYATWPLKLAKRMILAGCPECGTVLDPFMGSGTTALAARELGRKAIGIELSPTFLEMASRRLGQQSLFAQESA